jgi:hypothetical protein
MSESIVIDVTEYVQRQEGWPEELEWYCDSIDPKTGKQIIRRYHIELFNRFRGYYFVAMAGGRVLTSLRVDCVKGLIGRSIRMNTEQHATISRILDEHSENPSE